jgi:CRISPR-associated protein Cas5d
MTAAAGKDDNPGKHTDMARRRIERGQCIQQPSFGCREFPAYFELVRDGDSVQVHPELKGRRDLGWMLYDLDFSYPGGPMPHFFRAELIDGVLTVPARAFGAPI